MKQTISFLLALTAVLFCLTACSGEGTGEAYSYTASSVETSQIFRYGEDGVMTPIVYDDEENAAEHKTIDGKLGMLRSDLVKLLGEDALKTTTSGKYRKVATASAYFYFKAENMDAGAVAIVCLDSVYGFDAGVTGLEDVRAKMGADGKIGEAGEDELFFLPYAKGVTAQSLSYTCGKNTLRFYFIGGGLSATVLSVNGEWQ